MKPEPKRLLEQPGSDLDVLLLESALDEAPPSRAVDRTLVALGVASATTGLCAGVATTTAATVKSGAAGGAGLGAAGWFSSLSLVGKLGVGIAFVGAVVGVPYAVTREPAPAVAPLASAPGGVVDPADPNDATAPAPHPAADQPSRAIVTETPAPDPAPEKVAADKPAAGESASQAAPPRVASPKKGAAEEATASKPAADPKGGPSTLREEVRLLDAARSALRNGDKAAALGHLETYAARFPDGQMKAEAQAMRAVAKD